MKVSNLSTKNRHKLKGTSYFGIGFAGVFLFAGMLLLVLMSINSVAAQGDDSVSNVINVSDSQTLSANGASPGTELHFRTERPTPEERKAAAERFNEIYEPASAQARAQALAAPLGAPPRSFPQPRRSTTLFRPVRELGQQPDA